MFAVKGLSMIKIVGVDISLCNIGICKATIMLDDSVYVEGVSLIHPDKSGYDKKQVRKNSDDLRRMRWLHDELHRLIEDCDIIAVEMPIGSQSSRAMVSYGGCLGVLASVKKPMIEVTPTEVKLAGAGTKTASKEEMIQWATTKHPNANWKIVTRKGVKSYSKDNEHASDALAAIYAALNTDQFKTSMAFMKSALKIRSQMPEMPEEKESV